MRWAEIIATGSGTLRDPGAVIRGWQHEAAPRTSAPGPSAAELQMRFAAMGIPIVRGSGKTVD